MVVGEQHNISITTEWARYSVTFEIPSVEGRLIGANSFTTIGFILSSSGFSHQTGTFDIAQVKLELGSIATPLAPRPVAEELALCQRYYEIGNEEIHLSVISSNRNEINRVQFKTRKRIAPTINILNPRLWRPTQVIPTSTGITRLNADGFNPHFVLLPNAPFGSTEPTQLDWTADAEL